MRIKFLQGVKVQIIGDSETVVREYREGDVADLSRDVIKKLLLEGIHLHPWKEMEEGKIIPN